MESSTRSPNISRLSSCHFSNLISIARAQLLNSTRVLSIYADLLAGNSNQSDAERMLRIPNIRRVSLFQFK